METFDTAIEFLNQDAVVWARYNPIAAGVLAITVVTVCFLMIRSIKKNKKVAPVSEYEKAVADRGVRMSEKCRGRIVPELNGNDSIGNGVKQVLELNHQPSVDEVVDLLIEAGCFNHQVVNGNKEYLRNLVYTKMQQTA
jgi:hypothetical protein